MGSSLACCIRQNVRKKVDPVSSYTPKCGSETKRNGIVETQHPTSRVVAKREEKVRVHLKVDEAYKVCSAIGKGAFGFVIRAEHKISKKPYAIKIIELNKDGSHDKKSEIEILKKVDHPYVIRLHDVITTQRKLYLVMDLATGGELFDRIYQVGYFCEIDAVRVLRMILEGIQYLHAVGITHRDLKPENILYYHPGHDSRIIITDFGLAAIRKDPTANLMNTDCGTVEFMAPEVIVRDPYTNAVDMWSIGVITYILLSGQLPFPIEKNVYTVLRSICLGRYCYEGEPWDQISAEAKSFIDSLLVNDQRKRLSAGEALEHVWMKKRQPKKRNLQRSISSNWTESCISLNSKFGDTKAKKTRRDKETRAQSPKVQVENEKIPVKDEMKSGEQHNSQTIQVSEALRHEKPDKNKTIQNKDSWRERDTTKRFVSVTNIRDTVPNTLPPLQPTPLVATWNESTPLKSSTLVNYHYQ